ncbi:MAG TPA: class I SAM-dependent methyltransferase [Candidatus Saccharimonadales bacterium]|nr:class I SAM-dependent methyltransferase [Candidatus Saccharimonadales bacterium]
MTHPEHSKSTLETLRRQRHVNSWEEEHAREIPILPSVGSDKPSKFLFSIIDLATKNGIMFGPNVLDIGCGGGRNSLELRKRGFIVIGFDISENAISKAKKRAEEQNLSITFYTGAMDKQWALPDHSIDLIVDDTGSGSIGTLSGIASCRDQMNSTLKPNGYIAMVSLASTDQYLLRQPHGEGGTIITEQGWTDKLFSMQEIQEFYAPFQVIHQEIQSTPVEYESGEWERQAILTLLQKPAN